MELPAGIEPASPDYESGAFPLSYGSVAPAFLLSKSVGAGFPSSPCRTVRRRSPSCRSYYRSVFRPAGYGWARPSSAPVCPSCQALLTSALPPCDVDRTHGIVRFFVALSSRDGSQAVGSLLNHKALAGMAGIEPASCGRGTISRVATNGQHPYKSPSFRAVTDCVPEWLRLPSHAHAAPPYQSPFFSPG